MFDQNKYNKYKDAILKQGFDFNEDKINLLSIRQHFEKDLRKNKYDDLFVILGTDNGESILEEFPASTDPGVLGSIVMKSPQQLWYYKWLHRGKHPALRPLEYQKNIQYYKTSVFWKRKMKLVEMWKPTNIHAGGRRTLVGRWSEGCIVIAGGWEGDNYKRFLDLTYYNENQDRFLFTLLNKDLL